MKHSGLGNCNMANEREAKEDVSYQDYVIPKGCFVVPFLSAVHLDESYYKESFSFDPWRWLDPETQQKRNWRTSPHYKPIWWRNSVLSRSRTRSPSNRSLSALLHHYIQVDTTLGRSYLLLSFGSSSEWIQNPVEQTGGTPSLSIINQLSSPL